MTLRTGQAVRRSPISPEGHLVVDSTGYTADQYRLLHQHAEKNNGWLHPDGVRWIIPVLGPATSRGEMLRQGLPPESIEIAR